MRKLLQVELIFALEVQGFQMVRQKEGAYDRVQPYRGPTSRGHGSSSREKRASDASDQGISGMGSVSGGCDTMMVESKATMKKKGVEVAASNRSKVNVLVTILAVIYAQFILCIVAVIVIILHHNRSVDWLPALIDITGEGYKKTIPRDG
ncbi:hypothetical protein Y032_0052g2218 [Ancylostoma ceylanicum]|uniref:Uncharacterized protein n=1 Tax=Ancylostoma ceylanicum TaxID=53326 RepID=A0A016U868_9BILA|nr:hypothetical protein Y032_0052g2218 [Ancylostoma ceylanicum]